MIRMMVPAPQWIQQTPQGVAFAQSAGAAVFTNPLEPHAGQEGVMGGWHGMMGGRASDLSPIQTSNSAMMSIAPVDPEWQRRLDIQPSLAPAAGPLAWADYGIASAQDMSVMPSQPTIAPPMPSMSPDAMRTGLPKTPPVGNTTVSTFKEPPLDPMGQQKKPMSPPPTDDFDGAPADTKDTNWTAPDVTDGGYWESDWYKEEQKKKAAEESKRLAAEYSARHTTPPIVATPATGSSWVPLAVGVAAIAGIAWWLNRPQAAATKQGA